MNYIAKETVKQLMQSEKPSSYFHYLKSKNKISLFPELLALAITPQDTIWHPEGNVWTHTLMVIDVAAEFRETFENENEQLAFMLGALCHDFGKPYTTIAKDGRLKSPMHDFMGLLPTKNYLIRLGISELYEKVAVYVLEHLKPIQLYKNRQRVTDAAIIRLSKRIDIMNLYKLGAADHWGRTDYEAKNRLYPAGDWLLNKYLSISENKTINELSA